MKHLEYLLCSVSYYVCYYYVIIFAIMLAIIVFDTAQLWKQRKSIKRMNITRKFITYGNKTNKSKVTDNTNQH